MVSPRAKDLWLALFNVAKNEEAWAIIDKYLKAERLDAYGEAFIGRALTIDCECKFVDGTLKMCEHHAKEVIKTLEKDGIAV